MEFLRKYTIQHRFILLLALMLTGLIILSSISLSQAYQSLLQQKHDSNQQVVEAAYSVIEHFHQQQSDGKLSEEQAKKGAIEVLNSLRYDNSNYFWVNDFTPSMIMHPIKPALNGQNISGVKDPDGLSLIHI